MYVYPNGHIVPGLDTELVPVKGQRYKIFSNVLVTEDEDIRWLDDGYEPPEIGINHSGEWFPGKVDRHGEEIPYANKNARYTIGLEGLANLDPALDDPRFR